MSYDPGIPTAQQLISASQDPIRINFSQANTAFGIDHTDFATSANQGKHKKSTYVEQGADPVTIANEMAVYTKDVGGATRLFYRDEGGGTVVQATAAFSQVTAAAQGSSFLPGGLIIKWGSVLTPADTQAVTFTPAFPVGANVFSLTISGMRGSTEQRILYILNGTVSRTGFSFVKAGTWDQVFYMAIGM